VFSRKMIRSMGRSREARLEPGQHLDRPEIQKQIEPLAQRHIDAMVASADRSGDGPFQPDARAFQGFEHGIGQKAIRFSARARAPALQTSQSMATPVASTARTAAAATSGPMPSPGYERD